MAAKEFDEHAVWNEQGERSASVIQIENGKAVWAVALCASFAALGVGLSVFASYTATQAAMESRLLLQRVMILEAQQETEDAVRR